VKKSLFPLWRRRLPPPPAPDAPADQLTFIFAHIPKCGGKTFTSILQRNFLKTHYHEESLISFYPYTAKDVASILRFRHTLRALSSHRLTLDLPWTTSPRPIRALVFLRDPVERALSTYFFVRAHPGIDAPAKHLSIEEFLRHDQPNCTNFQAQFLSAGQLTVPHIAELARLGWAHLLPLERFDDAMLALERTYPANFTNCAYKILNQAPRDIPLDPAIRARLQKANTKDNALLALAHQHLDTLLARHFPTPAELANARAEFRRRCEVFCQTFPPKTTQP